ncbi:hypothetical protein OS493_012381 [Desmophyllum pertusum]|uniref:Uncharacterized protein n=1 Tax=Desmophyllum pertusum TaxID=174260 RepID=A0A9W9ZQF3_9CNID|nr:hypothetical protein OS493_012381 [Desmophyllum pertusum]
MESHFHGFPSYRVQSFEKGEFMSAYMRKTEIEVDVKIIDFLKEENLKLRELIEDLKGQLSQLKQESVEISTYPEMPVGDEGTETVDEDSEISKVEAPVSPSENAETADEDTIEVEAPMSPFKEAETGDEDTIEVEGTVSPSKKIRQNSEDNAKKTKSEKKEPSPEAEEWIAVSYRKSLKIIGRVLTESDTTITADFVDRRAGGYYQLKKNPEEVDKEIVFLRNVTVVWKGVGIYQVPDEKYINSKQVEHYNFRRVRQEVESCWDNSNLGQVMCQSLAGDGLTVADFKTIQPKMSESEKAKLLTLSPKFNVGWLNDKVCA